MMGWTPRSVSISAAAAISWPRRTACRLVPVTIRSTVEPSALARSSAMCGSSQSSRPDRIAGTVDTADGPYVTYDRLTAPARLLMSHTALLPVIESRLPDLPAEAELYLLVNGGGTGHSADDLNRAAEVAAGRRPPARKTL